MTSIDRLVNQLKRKHDSFTHPDYELTHFDYGNLNHARENYARDFPSGTKIRRHEIADAIKTRVTNFLENMGIIGVLDEKDDAFVSRMMANMFSRRDYANLQQAVARGQETDAYQIIESSFRRTHMDATIEPFYESLVHQPSDVRDAVFTHIGRQLLPQGDEPDLLAIGRDPIGAHRLTRDLRASQENFRRTYAGPRPRS